MAKNMTRDELLEELSLAITGGILDIQPDDISFKELSKSTGVKVETIARRAERGIIPEGWEVVERRGNNGQIMKCFMKI